MTSKLDAARAALVLAIAGGAAMPVLAQWQPVLRDVPPVLAPESPTAPPTTARDGLKIAAGGDLLGPYRPRLALEEPGLAAVAKVFQQADVGFANLEGNLFDTWKFTGYPAAENGGFELGGVGGGPLLPKEVASDLRRMGLRVVSTANNHALDWGVQGMFDTLASLEDAGIAHAGSGRTLLEARSAGVVDTPRGRVAFVAAATTYMPMAPAGAGGGDSRLQKAPRPGIAALRSRPIALVTAEELEALKRIAARQGKIVAAGDTEVTLAPNEAILNQQTFRVSQQPGLTYELHGGDRAGILAAVRAAKREADATVFSIHTQETASGGQEFDADPASLQPPDFLQPLAHDAIAAGADAVFVHGPHVLRGIEIYEGRPILYSLGSLFLELGSGWRPEWYDSVVATMEFRGGKVAELRLYPLTLGRDGEGRSRADQGLPRLATGARANEILESLRRQSAAYGTRIDIEKGVGVIRIGDAR